MESFVLRPYSTFLVRDSLTHGGVDCAFTVITSRKGLEATFERTMSEAAAGKPLSVRSALGQARSA